MRRITAVLLALILVGGTAAGQGVSPAAGTWGIETAGGGASLLRFRAPDKAWLVGFSVQLIDEERTTTSPLSGAESTTSETGVAASFRLAIAGIASRNGNSVPTPR